MSSEALRLQETPDEAGSGMEPLAILEALRAARRWEFPKSILEAALAEREKLAPLLCEQIALRLPGADGVELSEAAALGDWITPATGVVLLAEWRHAPGHSVICRALRLPSEVLDYYFADEFADAGPAWLAATFDGDLASLRSLIFDEAAFDFARGAGVQAVGVLTLEGRLERSATEALLRECFETFQVADETAHWSSLCETAAALRFEALWPEIERAHSRDLCEPPLDELQPMMKGKAPWEGYQPLGGLNSTVDALGAIKNWPYFHRDADANRLIAMSDEQLLRELVPKLPEIELPYDALHAARLRSGAWREVIAKIFDATLARPLVPVTLRDARAGLLLPVLVEGAPEQAHLYACRLARLPGETGVDVLGQPEVDVFTDLLVSTFAGDPEPLYGLAGDAAAADELRGPAIEALAGLVESGRVPREAVEAFYRTQFERPSAELGDALSQVLSICAATLGLRSLRPAMQEKVSQFGWKDDQLLRVLEIMLDRAEQGEAATPLPHRFDFDCYLNALLRFQPEDEDETESERAVAPVMPVVRESPKVGRNDPCPCGSGKKFKRCCG